MRRRHESAKLKGLIESSLLHAFAIRPMAAQAEGHYGVSEGAPEFLRLTPMSQKR
jgi:hypothetical protein